MLFLQGGPSQIETFDPKMTAPVEIRSITGEVQSRLPGVTFGGTFPSSPPWPTSLPSSARLRRAMPTIRTT